MFLFRILCRVRCYLVSLPGNHRVCASTPLWSVLYWNYLKFLWDSSFHFYFCGKMWRILGWGDLVLHLCRYIKYTHLSKCNSEPSVLSYTSMPARCQAFECTQPSSLKIEVCLAFFSLAHRVYFLPSAFFFFFFWALRCKQVYCCYHYCGNWTMPVPGSFPHRALQPCLLCFSLCIFCGDWRSFDMQWFYHVLCWHSASVFLTSLTNNAHLCNNVCLLILTALYGITHFYPENKCLGNLLKQSPG